LQKLEKNKHSFCTHIVKWPDLEAEVKNWITDYRNSGISLSTKIMFEARTWHMASLILLGQLFGVKEV
jgi:hypothetical protein